MNEVGFLEKGATEGKGRERERGTQTYRDIEMNTHKGKIHAQKDAGTAHNKQTYAQSETQRRAHTNGQAQTDGHRERDTLEHEHTEGCG